MARSANSTAASVDKRGRIFMPITVQMQRLYGLTAYLPAVLPAKKAAGLPDEVALVFYRTQASYDESKRCVGCRAYGAMHDLVFDMSRSPSDFARLVAGEIEEDLAYHLFERIAARAYGVIADLAGRPLADLAFAAVAVHGLAHRRGNDFAEFQRRAAR
jgi:hypothetical protein